MSNLLFYYFGDDEAYFKTLQAEFKRHTMLVIDFKRIYESNESKIQSLFIKIFKNRPACVFIDFSKNTQDYIHLARLVARTPLEHQTVVVGLVDYLSPHEVLNESNSTGINLTHIKSAESFDVVYDVAKLVSPNTMGEHGFAKAKLKNETFEVGVPCKVGYINGKGIHIETDHDVKTGDKILVKHHWLDRKLVPSKQFIVSNISNSNLFYQFKHNADLDFVFIDEFIPVEGMTPQDIKERQDERLEYIRQAKKHLENWIEDNQSRSESKKAKVLIIDKEFLFYQNQPRSDKRPYIIRCIPFFNNIDQELDRLRPQVVAFSLENGENGKNNYQVLTELAQLLRTKYKDLNAFLVVFNTKTASKELQSSLQYVQAMATDAEISVDVLTRIADIFEKKLEKVKVIDQKEEKDKIYLKKTNPASLCEILLNISVKSISETDIIFTSEYSFPNGVNLHLTLPVDMYINVQATKNAGEYQGLIHCLGESQKKDLRRYVNSIFFRDHDAKIQAETDEFKKLNETKLQQKIEEEKKASEEAQEVSDENAKEEPEKKTG